MISAANPATQRPPPRASTAPGAAHSRGPLGALAGLVLGLVFATFSSWVFGTALMIVGDYSFWKERGLDRARAAVDEDLGYIRGFPRSLMVEDTVGFAAGLAERMTRPYTWLGAPAFIARAQAVEPDSATNRHARIAVQAIKEGGRWMEISLHVARDTAIRLAVAFYALPAFVMAVCIGLIDGLVRRDLRKWSGGRESSYVYHHAKRFTWWFLTAGFTAYLAWPFGGFNPAYLVLVFALLVAASVSTTASTFKKYL
ncbi:MULTISPECIES: TIGR03747 family integrating conjugative element membrane protein [Aromatoleum]|uniref:Transmembrane protein n=2 Tax=Aromatoleum TaxID=551759 RepID=Q5P8M7_AROAE|nr:MULTISPECIES: TIGR03747 family integrating conjugative element membrane protein [Aromatoleum]MCK0508624.1 TIGR03747 family integrating conjugative element membrane protein [Aromatoleum anaerobium]CAI06332.1 hypothetical protein ebA405 [Aromatoleum aromaticum EbN1]